MQDGFIFADKTSVNSFVETLTTRNITDKTSKIYLSCQTTQARFIFKEMAPYFKSFKPADIGKSKLFITSLDTCLTANDLYVSKYKSLYPKDFMQIEQVFKEIKERQKVKKS
jgi:hypothetical protein